MRQVSVRVARADAERATAELLDLVPAGFEEREVPEDAETVELVLYGDPPSHDALRAAVGPGILAIDDGELPDDWAERWKAFHRPVRVGRVGIRPPWEPIDPDAEVDVVVDPGQAFGTGAHPTTRLCLELLLAHGGAWIGRPMADWGAGSGVLAVAAAKLGYSPVSATDFDPLSVEASRDNAAANGVELETGLVDLMAQPGPLAPVVCANLLRPLLLGVAARLEVAPELLIVSGLLVAEGDEIAAAFAPHGLSELDRRVAGEWTALALTAPPGHG